MNKALLLLLASFLLITSCKKHDSDLALASIIAKGKWTVTFMKDNGFNITPAYEDWEFIFLPNNTLTISDGIDDFTGSWTEDAKRRKFTLVINSAQIEFITISKEWDVDFKTPGRVTFKDNRLSASQELQFSKLP